MLGMLPGFQSDVVISPGVPLPSTITPSPPTYQPGDFGKMPHLSTRPLPDNNTGLPVIRRK